MLYRKMRVSLADAPDRLYRVFWLRENTRLDILAEILMDMLAMKREHLYEFIAGRQVYVIDPEEMDMALKGNRMSGYTAEDLGSSFRFIYDFGEDWTFDCRLENTGKNLDLDQLIIMEEAAGAGIFEDNKQTLFAYFSGEAPAGMRTDRENRGLFMPWNLDLNKLGDFDSPVDLDDMEALINRRYQNGISGARWAEFDRLAEIGDNMFMESDDSDIWDDVFDEFKDVCASLKEEGKLPERFDDLAGADDGPVNAEYLLTSMPGHYEEDERYDKGIQAAEELRSMFIFNEEDEGDLLDSLISLYCRKKKYNEAVALAEAYIEKYPDSYEAKAMLLQALAAGRQYDRADHLAEEALHAEMVPDALDFVGIAMEYARTRKNRNLEKKLERKYDEIFEMDEEDMDEDEDMLQGAGLMAELFVLLQREDGLTDELVNAAKNFFQDPNEDTYQAANLVFLAMAIRGDDMILDAKQEGEELSYSVLHTDDGEYLVLFTDEEAALRAGVKEMITQPVLEMLDEVVARGLDGFVLNPEDDDDALLTIAAGPLTHILDELYNIMAGQEQMLS